MKFLSDTFLVQVFVILFMVSGCRSSIELTNGWDSGLTRVDGVSTEWSGSLVQIESAPVSVGVRNDESRLFLCLATSDRFLQAQILFGGLTVSFDQDPSERSFAVRFPLRQDRQAVPASRERFEDIFRAFEPRLHSLMVGQGDDRQQYSLLDAPGIQVRIGVASDILVYELQVPIRRTTQTPYAAIPDENGLLKVNFETEGSDRDDLPGVSSRPGRSARRGVGGAQPSDLGQTRGSERLRFSAILHMAQSIP